MHQSSASPSRGPRRPALSLGAALLVLLAVGCSREPTAPIARDVLAPLSSTIQSSFPAPQSGPSYAPGRIIVRTREGASPEALAASYGSVVLGTIPELDLVLLSSSGRGGEWAFVRALLSDSRVVFAEVDFALQTAEGRQSTIAFDEGLRPWSDVTDQQAFQRLGVAEAQTYSHGRGVLVAVLDTGIDLDHPALASRIELPGFEPGVYTQAGDDRAEGLDTNQDGIVDGALGHGTHVAGIIAAIAPEARLLPVRVLDSDGVGFAFAICRGLVAAAARGTTIANLSLGMEARSQAVAAAIDYVRSFGVIVVAPAGNGGRSQSEFPAAYGSAMDIAGTAPDDRKASFSNYGQEVDLAAPAVGILSTYAGGGYATWSGTSMAAPFVSGVAALLYQDLGGRSADASAKTETLLRAGAAPLSDIDPIYGSLMGAGRISAIGSVRALTSTF